MSKVAVLALATTLGGSIVDPTTLNDYYDQYMVDLQHQDVFTQVALLAVVAGQAVYTLPEETSDEMAIFYDDTMLSRLTFHEMVMIDPTWRDRKGRPIGYVKEEQGDREIRLYPTPIVPSDPFIFSSGMPFGADFPRNALTVISPELRQDLPEWLDLVLAHRILDREFSHESNHRDPKFAAACAAVSDLLMGLLL